MDVSRRDVTTGLTCLGITATLGLPRRGRAQKLTAEDLARRLQEDLDACVRPGCPVTKLTVLGFGLVQTASGVRTTFRADAHVRLDWPPGMRQMPFLFYGPEPGAAYEGLLDRVVGKFAAVHPNYIG